MRARVADDQHFALRFGKHMCGHAAQQRFLDDVATVLAERDRIAIVFLLEGDDLLRGVAMYDARGIFRWCQTGVGYQVVQPLAPGAGWPRAPDLSPCESLATKPARNPLRPARCDRAPAAVA